MPRKARIQNGSQLENGRS